MKRKNLKEVESAMNEGRAMIIMESDKSPTVETIWFGKNIDKAISMLERANFQLIFMSYENALGGER